MRRARLLGLVVAGLLWTHPLILLLAAGCFRVAVQALAGTRWLLQR